MKNAGTKKHGRGDAPIILTATISFLLAFLFIGNAAATTYYVRTDGGSRAQCTGKADAAYSGSGQQQACAWRHPFDALPPTADTPSPPAPGISGGDTLLIKRGSYEMGASAPGASAYAACNADWSWDCAMPPIPAVPQRSPDAHSR